MSNEYVDGSIDRRTVIKGALALCCGRFLPILAGTTGIAAPAAAAAESYAARVREALSGQAIATNREHCSADGNRLATIGRGVGQQVRVRRSDSEYALYTVGEVRTEKPDTVVRMGSGARSRLNAPKEFKATVVARVPHATYTDEAARLNSEFVERLTDDGSNRGLVVCAPHGGMIERYTDQQAERVASLLAGKNASSWRCKGWKSGGGAYDRWHITSTDIHRASFPLLDSIADRGFAHAVSFHGIGSDNGRVLIGGRAPDALKQELKTAIETRVNDSSVTVEVVSSGPYAATSTRNFVNWLTAGGSNGVQIEQDSDVRAKHWAAVADAVAAVYDSKL